MIGVSAMRPTFTAPVGYQYGSFVDFTAPTEVTTTDVNGGLTATNAFNGSSAAVPHIAGAAALLVKQGYSGPTPIQNRLIYGAVDRNITGRDDTTGYGSVDVLSALRNRPELVDLSPTSTTFTTAGTRTFTAMIQDGYGPFWVDWSVTYSHDPRLNFSRVLGSTSLGVPVPEGSYTIRITTTVREATPPARRGNTMILDYVVCTSSAGQPSIATVGSDGGGATPDAKAGCGGSGGDEPR